MTNADRKVFKDVYNFYDSICQPIRTEEFWTDAADRMAAILTENGQSDLCRDMLVICYNHAANKIENSTR